MTTSPSPTNQPDAPRVEPKKRSPLKLLALSAGAFLLALAGLASYSYVTATNSLKESSAQYTSSVQTMHELDTNGDGKLSREELAAPALAGLMKFDLDKSGTLDPMEFFASLSVDPSGPEASSYMLAFREIDTDKDGILSHAELLEYLGAAMSEFADEQNAPPVNEAK